MVYNATESVGQYEYLVELLQNCTLQIASAFQLTELNPHALQESWNSHFELNLCVLLCLTLIFEVIILIVVWNKHSTKLKAGKSISREVQEDTDDLSDSERASQSLSDTIFRSEGHYKAGKLNKMSAIRKFFERKKLDKKFKKAGAGQTLNSPRQQPISPASSQQYRPATASNRGPTSEQQRAAEAALARMSNKSGEATARTGRDAIKAQVKREVEEERRQKEAVTHYSAGPTEVHLDSAHVVSSCGGVFFTSHLLPGVMASRQEIDEKVKEYLTHQLTEDAEMASALLIHTVNKSSDKVKVCIETLCKYIDNLLENPGVEKFRKIRCSNKAFQERVASVTGGTQFLLCAGYQLSRMPAADGKEEEFYVISEQDSMDADKLNLLKEVLINSEPIRAELWRAVRLFHCPSNSGSRFGELPDEFYAISKDEVKREQQAKQDAVEKLGMLRTKAMRERDELKELRRYRYTLLRVRFPGDIYLQAIFKSNEKLEDLVNFIRGHLLFDWLPFWFLSPSGQKLTEEEKTLAELHLVPACVVNFGYDKDLFHEAMKGKSGHVLDSSILERLENWSI